MTNGSCNARQGKYGQVYYHTKSIRDKGSKNPRKEFQVYLGAAVDLEENIFFNKSDGIFKYDFSRREKISLKQEETPENFASKKKDGTVAVEVDFGVW